MLKGEVLELNTGTRRPVSFFGDDTIDTIRSKLIDVHPNRLFILVGLKLPGDYYAKDPRRWEALFDRISFNGKPIEQEIFTEYQKNWRVPATAIPFKAYDRSEWMNKPDELRPLFESAEFMEYRIFGVAEDMSFILPLADLSPPLTARISAEKYPLPELSKLFTSFYKEEQFVNFKVQPYVDKYENVAPIYFPLLTSRTPGVLPAEEIALISRKTNLLDSLLKLKVPQPISISIIRTRFYIPWVETNLGASIRTRFEQIFYGLTVSKKVPYIGIYTSKDHVSRHKFFTEDAKEKEPYLDMSMWNAWWSIKPSRSIPTLILLRGKSRHHFDRIAITEVDMVISTYRSEGNTETEQELRASTQEWLLSLDAVLPFLSEADIHPDRWELQDMSYVATYSDQMDSFNLLRLNCLNTIFDMPDKDKSQFSLLRTDRSTSGLSAVEVKIIQMLKNRLDIDTVAEELSISKQNATALVDRVRIRVQEDPKLEEKSFRGYPTLQLSGETILVSSVSNLERSLQYSNILRFILSDPDSEVLNEICPKRVERVAAESAVVPTTEVDEEDEYGDLFGDLEEETVETTSVSDSAKGPTTVAVAQKRGTTYGYFQERLQKFDPETYDLSGSKYSKKCEQQPIVLSEKDLGRLKETPYDVSGLEESKVIDLENPVGKMVCPEYWCMKDQIPLSESQLEKDGKLFKCPVCHGKLQTKSTDKPREFPLIKRDSGFVYPGYKADKFPKSGKHMPCCFKTDKSKTMDKVVEADKYYIMGQDKIIEKERIAFLPERIIDGIFIPEKYEIFASGKVKRLMAPNKGYFRVGLGNPTESLPKFLGLKIKIPEPHLAVKTVLKCSFLHTWNKPGTSHLDEITKDLGELNKNLAPLISGISEAYTSNQLTPMQQLEYSALSLQCDVFRVFIKDGTIGCLFYTPLARARLRGIVVLQNEERIDILAYTERETRGFKFFCNVFEEPFPKDTYTKLEKLRNESCRTRIPSYIDALNSMQVLIPLVEADDYSIILDPFGRGQAFFIEGKLIVPFQSSPLPAVAQRMISGYSAIHVENLPNYELMKDLLTKIVKFNDGFEFKENLYNSKGEIVEILLQSGLRIPVKPVPQELINEASEVIETTRELGEDELVFGDASEDLRKEYTEISYHAEVYEFLLFQLTSDIKIDYVDIRNALREVSPIVSDVEPLLKKWFNETTTFLDTINPSQFISKIRKPCGETCDGVLCAMEGDTCKVGISSSINKEKLFHRLLVTLTSNSKMRAMVLDGRTSPFFSTILYLELPHELIVTDNDLPD